MYNLAQKLIAEFLGTFIVVLISTGTICTDQYLTVTGKPGLGVLGIAVATGVAIGVMVMAIGHISGGHFNPAVTIGVWVTRRLGSLHAILYWAAQLLGAMAGAYTVKSIVSDSFWEPVALGTPALAPDFSRTHAMALEGVITFLWVFVFFATVIDAKGAFDRIAVFATGLSALMGTLLAYPFTGAAMSPARAFGPALASGHWTNHGVYWVGPLFGGVLAGFMYDRILLRRRSP